MIDRQTIDRIIDAADIVEVVSDFVTLKKRGTSYKGLCPFHDDTTPSFSVSPTKGVYKCFACGEAGNAVGFVMKHEQMTYPEALRWLAKKYHIEIKEKELTNEERQAESERESMFIVNEWAAHYFHETLTGTEEGQAYGMQYFRSRGIRDDIIKKFQLGYSLRDRNALSLNAKTKGYKEEFLQKTGLCYLREPEPNAKDQTAKFIDRFAGRVIFPWFSVSGKVVAFGGRLLDSRTKGVAQKYVNSPDSDIYHKERELYGIFQAKKAIAKEDCVYMVEGYTDVIAMHQCGIENVVANSGTALSYHQIRTLHRFTPNIVLLYDGDEAGIHAAMRGTDMLLSEGMNIKVLLLPDGDDPDSFARKHTASDFRRYIDEHQTDFIVFKINQMLNGVTDPIKRSEAVNSIVKSISVIKDQILRETYVRECAMRTGMAEQTIIAQMNKMIYNAKESKESPAPNPQPATPAAQHPSPNIQHSTSNTIETLLIQMVIRHGEEIILTDVQDEESGQTINLNVAQYINYDLSLDDLKFETPIYNTILADAVQHCNDEGFKAEDYFTHHHDIEISTLAIKLSTDDVKLAKSIAEISSDSSLRSKVEQLIIGFRKEWIEQQLAERRKQMSLASGDMTKTLQLMNEIKQLQDMRNILARRLGNDIIVKRH
ncbi:MAG: DNA primase [Prevotella sp.]|nr:DNA primase [Prevotella sp.]